MRAAGLLLLGCLTGCRTLPDHAATRPVLGSVPSLAVPRTARPPVVDGVLDDPAWEQAATIPALLPPLRTNSVAPIKPLPTVVRVLWDPQYLYVSFECVDPEVFCTGSKQHDDLLYQEDVVEVFLDGVGDGRQFVEIQVNPEGVNLDLMYLFTRAAEYTPEMRLTAALCETDRWKFLEWEMTGLRTAARRTATGWTAELAIPAGDVMKRRGSRTYFPTEIRANFVRYDWANAELQQQSWSPVLLGNPHNSPARMGQLRLVGTK